MNLYKVNALTQSFYCSVILKCSSYQYITIYFSGVIVVNPGPLICVLKMANKPDSVEAYKELAAQKEKEWREVTDLR